MPSPGSWRSSVQSWVNPTKVAGFVRAHGASGNLALVGLAYGSTASSTVASGRRSFSGLGYTSQAVLVLAHEGSTQ